MIPRMPVLVAVLLASASSVRSDNVLVSTRPATRPTTEATIPPWMLEHHHQTVNALVFVRLRVVSVERPPAGNDPKAFYEVHTETLSSKTIEGKPNERPPFEWLYTSEQETFPDVAVGNEYEGYIRWVKGEGMKWPKFVRVAQPTTSPATRNSTLQRPNQVPAASADATGEHEFRTAHYEIYNEGKPDPELGHMLETLHARLKTFFGGEPQQILRVKILADQRRYVDAIVKDGQPKPDDNGGWGIYDFYNHVAYIPEFATTYETRQSVLHECTHQFHWLARNHLEDPPKSLYYREGLAVHFSMHRWNGSELAIGVVPDIEGRDIPAEALEEFKSYRHHDFRSLATDGAAPADRPNGYAEAWGLVSFLIDRYPDRYRRWSAALDAMQSPEAAWKAAFDPGMDRALSVQYETWLKEHQVPWDTDSGKWGYVDQHTLEGAPDNGYTLALRKSAVTSIKASIQTERKAEGAGVVFAYTEPANERFAKFEEVLVVANGKIWLMRFDKQWSNELLGSVKDGHRFDISLKQEKGGIEVFVNNALAYRESTPVQGRAGLVVRGGAALFRNLAVN